MEELNVVILYPAFLFSLLLIFFCFLTKFPYAVWTGFGFTILLQLSRAVIRVCHPLAYILPFYSTLFHECFWFSFGQRVSLHRLSLSEPTIQLRLLELVAILLP